MLSNPPYDKHRSTDLDKTGGKEKMTGPRFVIGHGGDVEYSLATRSSDGQLVFLASMVSKMKCNTPMGSRIAEAHNGRLPSPPGGREGKENQVSSKSAAVNKL